LVKNSPDLLLSRVILTCQHGRGNSWEWQPDGVSTESGSDRAVTDVNIKKNCSRIHTKVVC